VFAALSWGFCISGVQELTWQVIYMKRSGLSRERVNRPCVTCSMRFAIAGEIFKDPFSNWETAPWVTPKSMANACCE
jgi:hypothetical protein